MLSRLVMRPGRHSDLSTIRGELDDKIELALQAGVPAMQVAGAAGWVVDASTIVAAA